MTSVVWRAQGRRLGLKTSGIRLRKLEVMKPFVWSREKNAWLKVERQLSFEVVVAAIQSGELLDVLEHPNPERYPGQHIGSTTHGTP